MSHPHSMLEHDGEPVEIDVEIVPLIELVWSHGLDTFNSCQDFGGDGQVWVEFDGPSATDFLNLVAGQDRELRGHILRSVPIDVDYPEGFDAYQREHGWTYSVLPWPGWGDDPHAIRFVVSIHFPRGDLPAVVAALEAAQMLLPAIPGDVPAEGRRGLARFVQLDSRVPRPGALAPASMQRLVARVVRLAAQPGGNCAGGSARRAASRPRGSARTHPPLLPQCGRAGYKQHCAAR